MIGPTDLLHPSPTPHLKNKAYIETKMKSKNAKAHAMYIAY
jgi:hypothetical protein